MAIMRLLVSILSLAYLVTPCILIPMALTLGWEINLELIGVMVSSFLAGGFFYYAQAALDAPPPRDKKC